MESDPEESFEENEEAFTVHRTEEEERQLSQNMKVGTTRSTHHIETLYRSRFYATSTSLLLNCERKLFRFEFFAQTGNLEYSYQLVSVVSHLGVSSKYGKILYFGCILQHPKKNAVRGDTCVPPHGGASGIFIFCQKNLY